MEAFQKIMKVVRDNSGVKLTEALKTFTKEELIEFISEMDESDVFSEIGYMYADLCEIYPEDENEE
jgi:hypothetical protein